MMEAAGEDPVPQEAGLHRCQCRVSGERLWVVEITETAMWSQPGAQNRRRR